MSTFALVHGHWHGSWCWSRLAKQLEGTGHGCVAIDLPCTRRDAGAAENSRVVVAALEGLGEDVILVGHSAGGLTIPVVAQRRPVRHLVFPAALLPLPGKSLAQQFAEDAEIIDPNFKYVDHGDGFCFIDPLLAAGFFYNDCSAADARWATARLRRQTTLTITEQTPLEEWPNTPRSYIFGDQDRVIRPAWAARAALTRVGVEPVAMAGAGHSLFLSQPELLATHLLRIANSYHALDGSSAS